MTFGSLGVRKDSYIKYMPLFVGVTKGVVRETRTTAKGKKTWLFCKGKILDVRVSMNAIASALAHVLSRGSCPHEPLIINRKTFFLSYSLTSQ